MGRHVIGRGGEIPPGQRRIVELEGRSIGVFNVKGTFYALRNACPHQAGPLCLGQIRGLLQASDQKHLDLSREGEILRCPWHGWEFDLTHGRAICEPHRTRVRTYDVTVEPAEPPAAETYPITVEADCIVLHL